jgi:transposase
MRSKDARSLSPDAQEALRVKAVSAVRRGMTQAEAAEIFGVTRASVNKWSQADAQHGRKALRSRKRGRPPGTQLKPHEAALTVRTIIGRCPDQLRLPFYLWTREAVQMLLEKKFGLRLSVWTVGRYLKRWGLTPQKPMRRAFEQDPEAVRRWLEQEYPTIESEAKRLRAHIFWGDEMGLRSDYQAGCSYGRRGETPVIPGTGRRFGCNMISVITNRGKLMFMVFEKDFNAAVFVRFLTRLIRQVKHRIFLIVDRHPAHRAAATKRWLERHATKIRMYFLPTYSPDLNPDESLNHDVKANALGRRRPVDEWDMMAHVRGYLRARQRQPDLVRAYFYGPQVQYAMGSRCQL